MVVVVVVCNVWRWCVVVCTLVSIVQVHVCVVVVKGASVPGERDS